MWIEFGGSILNLDNVISIIINEYNKCEIKSFLIDRTIITEVHSDISFSEQRLLQLKRLLVNNENASKNDDVRKFNLEKLFHGRALNILKCNGLKDLRDIEKFTYRQIIDTPNCGRKTMDEISHTVDILNLKFKGEK